jgi:RNA-directed DNA polymerase
VEQLLDQGSVYVVDADLKSYFDTIPKAELMACVREKVSDSRVLRLIEMFLEQGVMDGLREWTPETGTPQGAVLSPLLANIYLNPLDHMIAEAGFAMVRYADDFVILCATRESAERALALVQCWVQDNGLTLHPTKTKIVHANSTGFEFLGYRFRGRYRAPRNKSLKKFNDAVRAKTKRNNANSLPDICKSLSFHLRGWFNYFRHCTGTVYRDLDQWIRDRLRGILRRRKRRRGRARWVDHQQWPIAYFDVLGLYSLSLAHTRFVQSSMG